MSLPNNQQMDRCQQVVRPAPRGTRVLQSLRLARLRTNTKHMRLPLVHDADDLPAVPCAAAPVALVNVSRSGVMMTPYSIAPSQNARTPRKVQHLMLLMYICPHLERVSEHCLHAPRPQAVD